MDDICQGTFWWSATAASSIQSTGAAFCWHLAAAIVFIHLAGFKKPAIVIFEYIYLCVSDILNEGASASLEEPIGSIKSQCYCAM